MEGPVFWVAELKVRLLICAVTLRGYELERVLVIGEEAQDLLDRILDCSCAPKGGLSNRNDEGKVASPRFRAVVICPLFSSIRGAIRRKDVGCDFEKIN